MFKLEVQLTLQMLNRYVVIFVRFNLWTQTVAPNCTDLKQAVKKTNGKKEVSVRWRSWNMAIREHTESSWEETRRLKSVQIITVSLCFSKNSTHNRHDGDIKFCIERPVYSRAFPKVFAKHVIFLHWVVVSLYQCKNSIHLKATISNSQGKFNKRAR